MTDAAAGDRFAFHTVADQDVWHTTKLLFFAALGFFFVNITLGFFNAVTVGAIDRWQIVTHLHSAALGWFTLSVIAIAIWVFTADRAVSDSYHRTVRVLASLAIVAVAGYVASFALAFSQGGALLNLLPVGGGSALLVFWVVTIWTLLQVRHQPVVTTVHLFVAAALLVLSIGGTMGVLIGLNRATGGGIAEIGAHAPVMLFYLLLVAAAIVEGIVSQGSRGRWSRWGGLQAVVLVIAAVVPPVAITLDLMMLMPVMLLGLVVFFLLFLVRVGWKALYTNPLMPGPRAWTFFGTLWLIPVVLVFPAEVAIEPPSWFFPVVAHMAFVGMTSNLLFGVLTVRTTDAPSINRWVAPGAMWVLNLGLFAFLLGKITMDVRHGALLMGLGALGAVGVMLYRLYQA